MVSGECFWMMMQQSQNELWGVKGGASGGGGILFPDYVLILTGPLLRPLPLPSDRQAQYLHTMYWRARK